MHPDDRYPGWEYQKLFDHMSEAHGLDLTKDEMDAIISKAAETIILLDGVESLTE